jgi:hypothetical protein
MPRSTDSFRSFVQPRSSFRLWFPSVLRPSAWYARPAPAAPDVTGVEGNARLTSTTGMVLLVLLAVEGVTLLDVHGLITLHVFLGTLLVGPVALKTASTVFRFVRYYTGAAEYLRKGPPPPGLRAIGPLVIVSSIALLGTGIGLLAIRPGGGLLLTAHQVSFFGWFAVMTMHVLGHLWEASVTTWRELRNLSGRQLSRLAIVLVALAVGMGIAAAVLPSASGWTHRPADVAKHHHRPHE